jgi:hypothetical protein
MRKLFATTLALAATLTAAPAMAESQMVILTPGSSQNWTQRQPTHFMTTEQSQVLPDGLCDISVGAAGGAMVPGATRPAGGLGAVAGSAFNYRRGMGGGGELDFSLGLNANAGGGQGFFGSLGGGWKHQLSLGQNLAVAINGGLFLTGFGSGGAIMPGAVLGLPLTFDAGLGHLTIQPRIADPDVTNGTADTNLGAAVGFQTPIASNWQLLAEVVPSTNLGGGGFLLPFGVGTRFSPNATSHVDIGVGQFNVSPGFGGSLGLLNVTGHIGF